MIFWRIFAWVLCGFAILIFLPVLNFNNEIFRFINDFRFFGSDQFWFTLTTLGDGLLLSIILGAILMVNPRVTFLGLTVLILSSVVVHIVKALFNLPRPAVLMDAVHIVGPVLRSGSFPSGHAAASVSACLAVAYFLRSKWAGFAVMLMGTLISTSRIAVGAHFPVDVVGGTICAAGVFLILERFCGAVISRIPDEPAFSSPLFRCALGLEFAATVFTLTIYSYSYSSFPAVSIVVSAAVLAFLIYRFHCRWSARTGVTWTSMQGTDKTGG